MHGNHHNTRIQIESRSSTHFTLHSSLFTSTSSKVPFPYKNPWKLTHVLYGKYCSVHARGEKVKKPLDVWHLRISQRHLSIPSAQKYTPFHFPTVSASFCALSCSVLTEKYAALILACTREVSARYAKVPGGRGLGERKLFVIRPPSCWDVLEAQIFFSIAKCSIYNLQFLNPTECEYR